MDLGRDGQFAIRLIRVMRVIFLMIVLGAEEFFQRLYEAFDFYSNSGPTTNEKAKETEKTEKLKIIVKL